MLDGYLNPLLSSIVR